MAKLNNVKVIVPTVAQIEYQGSIYEESTKKAATGDILRYNSNENGHDVTVGAYYEVVRLDSADDAQIIDDEGDEYDTVGDDVTVFKRVVGAAAPATSDIVTHEGVQYRKVAREANKGELVVVTANTTGHSLRIGEIVKITRSGTSMPSRRATDALGTWMEADCYLVLEPIAAQLPSELPEPYVIHDGKVYLKEAREATTGDKVIVVSGHGHWIKVGEVVTAEDARNIRGNREQFSDADTRPRSASQWVGVSTYRVLVPVDSITLGGVEYAIEKRKPAIGEYVLVVKATQTSGKYDNGTISKAVELDWANDPRINGRATVISEYVVLARKEPAATPPSKPEIKVGDSVRINIPAGKQTNSGRAGVSNDEVGKVTRVNGDSVVVTWPSFGSGWNGIASELDVVDPAKPARLTIGDYAKVIAQGNSHNYAIGEIIRISVNNKDEAPYKGVKASDGSTGNWLREHQVERATQADFEKAQAEAGAKKAASERLKVGDYAKVIHTASKQAAGTIVKITRNDRESPMDYVYESEQLNGERGDIYGLKEVVRATDAEVRAAQYAVKIGDFTDGDYAVITSPDSDNADYDVNKRVGQYVKVNPYGESGIRGLTLTFTDGWIGHANASALRKVTREEYEAATNPKPKYSVGDYVKVTRFGGGHNYRVGEIVKIEEISARGNFSGTKASNGERGNWLQPDQIEPATEAEYVEESKTAKWAAIGRTENEFKEGDLVRVVGTLGSPLRVGEIAEVVTGDGTPRPRVKGEAGTYWAQAELVTPVEQRFDKVA